MKYFTNIRDDIKKEFEFIDTDYVMHANQIMEPIKEKYPNCVTIGIHIQKGDEVLNKEEIEQFLSKALLKFKNIENKIFLVFSGGNQTNDNTE